MAWRDLLNDVNLVWTTLGTGVAGLTGAFGAGFVAGRWSLKGPMADLQDQSIKLNSENATLRAERDSAPHSLPANDPKIDESFKALPAGVQLWLRDVGQQDGDFARSVPRIPTLAVANLKGGVAKTMLAANLAAYFATRANYPKTAGFSNKRVLLVDLDYQGSLSSMVTPHLPKGIHPQSQAETLLRTEIGDLDALHRKVQLSNSLHAIHVFPTEYGFDDFETREQFAWLSNPAEDLRFRLLRRLASEPFREHFDLIILDTGPRLSTALVTALAAATHVLVPTTLDLRSMQAAEGFLRRLWALKTKGVCPELRLAGIVPTLVQARQQALMNVAHARLRASVAKDVPLKQWVGDEPFFQAELNRSDPIMNAAEAGVPYLQETAIRTIFNHVGAELEQRMQS